MSDIDFLLFDFETEGLLPERDKILEAAAMLIDSKTLKIKDRQHFLCFHPELKLTETTRRMHRNSGLILELEDAADEIQTRTENEAGAPITPYRIYGDSNDYPTIVCSGHRELDIAMADYVIGLGYEGASLTLCGTGIHFDRRFILEHCPHFNAFLHYRMEDLRSPLLLYKAWLNLTPKIGEAKHRAMADIEGGPGDDAMAATNHGGTPCCC